ncbi:MAG: PadR family transcriptional regulator [Anaerolineales bacterium]|nr:PadR family transcriptional regulator [Anaerolineales bacterium]
MDRELLLLGLLRQEEMHGYRLVGWVESDLRYCTDLKKPTVYFLLGKMEKAGWVARTRSRQGKRPPRWVYRITEAGEAQFQELLRTNLSTYKPSRFTGDVGLAFLSAVSAKEAAECLGGRRQQILAEQDSLRHAPFLFGSTEWVASHQRAHLEAEARWLDALLAALAGNPPWDVARPAAGPGRSH